MIYLCRLPDPFSDCVPGGRRLLAHAAAFGLLEAGLRAEYGLDSGRLWFERGDCGKPALAGFPDIHFNFTHCAGLAACAIAPAAVGIDAERVGPRREPVMKRAYTQEERLWIERSPDPDEAFFRLWTLKESFVKAVGEGLGYGLQRVPIVLGDGPRVSCGRKGFHFSQRILWGTHVVSVCTGPVPAGAADRTGMEEELAWNKTDG